MDKQHQYSATIRWTGNRGEGTRSYEGYDRDHIISGALKSDIPASSDPAFHGDKSRYNPEELLVASLSSCHMLWYLHLCAKAGVVVVDYTDHATGIMSESATDRRGRFTEVTLNPIITVTDQEMVEKALSLHEKANELCYIANSVNFPVNYVPEVITVNSKEPFQLSGA